MWTSKQGFVQVDKENAKIKETRSFRPSQMVDTTHVIVKSHYEGYKFLWDIEGEEYHQVGNINISLNIKHLEFTQKDE